MVNQATPKDEGQPKRGPGRPRKTHNSEPNFTQMDVLAAVRRRRELDDKKEALTKEFKALNRELKRVGITLKLFNATYNRLNMTDMAIERAERERIKLERYMGLPIGTQMGFFDEKEEIQQQEFDAADPENGTPAFRKGRLWGAMNLDSASPFQEGTPEDQDFQKGRLEGQKDYQEFLKREKAQKEKA